MINNLTNINQFDFRFKECILSHDSTIIDNGIKELVDSINSIEEFCTINSCQGFLIKKERYDHAPITYVDFYVLYHNYNMAFNLFRILTHKIGSLINCTVNYEADQDYIDDDYVEDNGLINMRFRIEIYEPNESYMTCLELYKKIINEINSFKEEIISK